MSSLRFSATLFLASLSAYPLMAADAASALATYKTGDYKTAISVLQAASADPSASPEVKAALLSALTYEGRVDDAATLETSLAASAPNDPIAMTARGEFLFYMGDVAGAEKLFRAALKIKEENARACYGLYRLLRAASYYKTARIYCLRAHALDPEDALVTLAFIRYTVGEKRREMLVPFMTSHPWFAQVSNFEAQQETAAEVHEQLAERKAFERTSR